VLAALLAAHAVSACSPELAGLSIDELSDAGLPVGSFFDAATPGPIAQLPQPGLDAGTTFTLDGGTFDPASFAFADGGPAVTGVIVDDGGSVSPGDAGPPVSTGPLPCALPAAPGAPPASVPSGTVEHSAGFEQALVRPPASCVGGDNLRTCTDGQWSAWSNGFPAPSCVVEGYKSCEGKPHGTIEPRAVFPAATQPDAATCSNSQNYEFRTCDDGTWSAFIGAQPGWASSCAVALGGACMTFGELAAFACADGVCTGLAGYCLRPVGSACTRNAQCAGTCINQRCTAPSAGLGVCDDNSDCAGCSAGGLCTAGVCTCNNGSTCGANAECTRTCRQGRCAALATGSLVCDPNDQADCADQGVCTQLARKWACFADLGAPCTDNSQCDGVCIRDDEGSGTCSLPSQNGGPCDGAEDCDVAATKCVDGACRGDKGEFCQNASQCASAECTLRSAGNGSCK
jgi:hypothetical protein